MSPDDAARLDLPAEAPLVVDVRDAGVVLRPRVEDAALRPYLAGRPLTTPGEILAARRLHAEVYAGLGWFAPEAVGPDGGLRLDADPWQAVADWYGSVRDGAVRAVARTLAAPDPGMLPALRLDGVDAAERRALLASPPGAVVEFSAFARRPDAARSDAPAVVAAIWRESLRLGHETWVMAVDVAVYRMLRRRVAGTAIRAVGPEQHYLGSPVVPAVLPLRDLPAAQAALAREHPAEGADPLPALLPRLFPATRSGRR